MSRVLALVEGPTERSILDNVVSPNLSVNGIYLSARVLGKPGHKGGNKFSVVLRELRNLIRQEPSSFVTMFFDYYGLTNDWPELARAKCNKPYDALGILESAIAEAVAASLGADFDSRRFIPYLQLHELESLLFSGPTEMSEVFDRPELKSEFERIVLQCDGCELIDDDPVSAPSKRIQALFPTYRKGRSVDAHAHRIAARIGLERMRRACPHFNDWLKKLENLK